MDFLEGWIGAGPASTITAAAVVLGSGVAVLFIMRAFVLPRANRLARRTAFRWDDVISDRSLRRWLAFLSATVVVRLAGPARPELETEQMPLMVRQLQPGHHGLPIEIYAFTRLTDWEAYEALQGDIVSHTVAVLERFGLRPFQEPTDAAVRSIDLSGSEPRSVVGSSS